MEALDNINDENFKDLFGMTEAEAEEWSRKSTTVPTAICKHSQDISKEEKAEMIECLLSNTTSDGDDDYLGEPILIITQYHSLPK